MPKRVTANSLRDAARPTAGRRHTAWRYDTLAHAPEPAPFGRPWQSLLRPAHYHVLLRHNVSYGVATWRVCLVLRRNTLLWLGDLQRVLSDAPLRLRVHACKALVVCAALPKRLALFGRERQLLLDQRHALEETADSAHTDPEGCSEAGWACVGTR